jgi:putative ABC transport system permease protein
VTLLRLIRIAGQRLRSLARPSRLDADLERELAIHFDQLVLENLEAGMPPAEARQAARRTLGNVVSLKEECRDSRGVNWLRDLRQDVVYGVRMLVKHPAFTAVAVLSLALGIGANTAILGVMQSVLIDDLPLPDADRLVVIRSVPLANPAQMSGASLLEFFAWRDRSRAFDAIEVSIAGPRDLGADNGTPADRITGQSVTGGWFATFGAQALLGRVLTQADNHPRSDAVVISQRLWESRYGADPGILNRRIRVGDAQMTIVGVMSRDFRFSDPRVDCWVPLYLFPNQAPGGGRYFGVTARLKPGVSVERAQADLSAIAAQLAKERPERQAGWGVRVRPLGEALFGWAKEPLLTLWVAAALVLLIACANVGGLQLSRASVRHREIALRVSLGAGRARIVRQLVTESVLLSFAGGILGLFVAWWGIRGLMALTPPIGLPFIAGVGFDVRVLAVAAALSFTSAIVFGVGPAFAASHLNPILPLKEPDPAAAHGDRQLARTALVSAQLALALILLIGTGLLVNSFLRLSHRDLNFDPSGLLTFEFNFPVPLRPLGQYRGFTYFEMDVPPSQTMKRVLERLRAVPGADSVAAISFQPVNSLILPVMDVIPEDQTAPQPGGAPQSRAAAYFLITPGLFHTLRTPLLRGRDINDRDTAQTPWVAIVNETAARRFWGDADPIGRRFTLDSVPEEQPREVIGVVKDIPTRHGQTDPQPVIYASYLQQPLRYRGPWAGMFGQMTFMVRHAGDVRGLTAAARSAVAEIEPNRPIGAIITAQQRLNFGRDRLRYRVFLVGTLAATAAVLAAIGVYGTLAYAVSQRTREIGIRKALGASTLELIVLVGRRAVLLTAAGLAAGCAGALALTRLIESQLWGITATDPATYASVSLVLVLVAFLACLGPTRQALAIDPTMALRRD